MAPNRVVSRGADGVSRRGAVALKRDLAARRRQTALRTNSGFGFLNLEFAIWEGARVHDGGEAGVDTTGKEGGTNSRVRGGGGGGWTPSPAFREQPLEMEETPFLFFSNDG